MGLVPAVLRGVIAVQVDEEEQDTHVIVSVPILIAVTPLKLRPVIVTSVPPALGPFAGLIRVMTGLAATPVPVTTIAVPAVSPVTFRMALTAPVAVGAKETVAG